MIHLLYTDLSPDFASPEIGCKTIVIKCICLTEGKQVPFDLKISPALLSFAAVDKTNTVSSNMTKACGTT